MTRLSSRLAPHGGVNALTRRLEALRAAGAPYADLTLSNPTVADIPYPPELLASLAGRTALRYEPSAFGLRTAREAIAADAQRRGAVVDPAHIVLSASTSEAYSWLFKLLCDAGDAVLVPRPSYPLFEHLTALELVEAVPYDLVYHGCWEVDFARIMSAPDRTRAVLAVSPNNPTGSYLSRRDAVRLAEVCDRRGWALIVDEVFADYPLEADAPATDIAADAGVLTFTLGGASKSLGLPQVKLGWMFVGGPPTACDRALTALELIADTFLSVSTPVQMAAPALLRDAAAVRDAIHARVRENLSHARTIAAEFPSCTLLRTEGGWSAAIRVPATRPEEQLVLDLLDRERVLVHPGYFFDFPTEAFIVVSLLPAPGPFVDALRRTLALAHS